MGDWDTTGVTKTLILIEKYSNRWGERINLGQLFGSGCRRFKKSDAVPNFVFYILRQ